MKNHFEQNNRAFSCCQVEKRSKNGKEPVLPIDLLEYSLGELVTSDLFEIGKDVFITVTDSGLIL